MNSGKWICGRSTTDRQYQTFIIPSDVIKCKYCYLPFLLLHFETILWLPSGKELKDYFMSGGRIQYFSCQSLCWVFFWLWIVVVVVGVWNSQSRLPNMNHMVVGHVSPSDKSTLFSLSGSIYMKMWQIQRGCRLSIIRSVLKNNTLVQQPTNEVIRENRISSFIVNMCAAQRLSSSFSR